jgi:hypothetical protein
MKKFVVMYRVPVDVIQKWKAETSQEEMKAQGEKLGKEMSDWMAKHKASIVDNGLPLGKNTRMTMKGAAPTTNDLNYYQVVQAENVEQVVEMFKDNPHMSVIPEAFLDIMEVPPMGM